MVCEQACEVSIIWQTRAGVLVTVKSYSVNNSALHLHERRSHGAKNRHDAVSGWGARLLFLILWNAPAMRVCVRFGSYVTRSEEMFREIKMNPQY